MSHWSVDLGITGFGGRVYQHTYHFPLQAHLTHAHPIDVGTKPKKLPRPSISNWVTTEEWGYFTNLWSSYREAMKLSTNDARTQLLACCDPELRRDLHQTDNQLGGKSADIIMATIKSLPVRTGEYLSVA